MKWNNMKIEDVSLVLIPAYLIIALIFIIVALTCTAFAQEAPAIKQPQKVVVFNKTLYMCTIDNNRNFGVSLHAIKLDREKEIKTYFLPFSIVALDDESYFDGSVIHPKKVYQYYPLSWDIAEDHFFAIFVSDSMSSNRRGFGLLKIPLAKLKEFENLSDKEKSEPFAPDLLREFFVRSIPIWIHLLDMNQRTKPLHYDFYITDKDIVEFYYLSGNTMTISRYEKKRWNKLAEYKPSFAGDFKVVKINQNSFLLSDANKLFKIDGLDSPKDKNTENKLAEIKLTELAEEKDIQYLLVNKDTNRLFWISPQNIIDSSIPPIKKRISKVAVRQIKNDKNSIREVLQYLRALGVFEKER